MLDELGVSQATDIVRLVPLTYVRWKHPDKTVERTDRKPSKK